MSAVSSPPPTFATVLSELALLQAGLRRLETRILQLMREAGISDEVIADELGISPQAVGRKRRRSDP